MVPVQEHHEKPNIEKLKLVCMHDLVHNDQDTSKFPIAKEKQYYTETWAWVGFLLSDKGVL